MEKKRADSLSGREDEKSRDFGKLDASDCTMTIFATDKPIKTVYLDGEKLDFVRIDVVNS